MPWNIYWEEKYYMNFLALRQVQIQPLIKHIFNKTICLDLFLVCLFPI